jgi:hypothetical protein
VSLNSRPAKRKHSYHALSTAPTLILPMASYPGGQSKPGRARHARRFPYQESGTNCGRVYVARSMLCDDEGATNAGYHR